MARAREKPAPTQSEGGASRTDVGSDQVSGFTSGSLVAFALIGAILIVAILWYADYLVWTVVSPVAAIEAVGAESNVGLAIAAFFAIWSSGQESQNTRETLSVIGRERIRETEVRDLQSSLGKQE